LIPFYNGYWDQNDWHNPYHAEGYRLPTEAEWEYSARYNDGRSYPWGETAPECSITNFAGGDPYCTGGWTAPVGSYPLGASELGLMDMAGNLSQWIGDYWGGDSYIPITDPLGDLTGIYRVLRGGGWYHYEGNIHSASRWFQPPDRRLAAVGFRVCRTANPPANDAPQIPHSPLPQHAEVAVDANPVLGWSCLDPDGDALLFDVYFGTAPSPGAAQLLSQNQTSFTFLPGQLDYETTYYWQVIAKDGFGHQQSGPVWSYTTEPPEFIMVTSGTFTMGQAGVYTPEHQVIISEDYWLGVNKVSNEQYLEALEWALNQGYLSVDAATVEAYGEVLLELNSPFSEIIYSSGELLLQEGNYNNTYGPGFAYPGGYDPADHPVKKVSWFGAACYCDWRSEMEGLQPFYLGNWDQDGSHNPYTAEGYHLPTEAQWEYAARYNDSRTFPWGENLPTCTSVNFAIGSNYCIGWTTPAGTYPAAASALGFLGMSGNLSEWVADWHAPYSASNQTDPFGASAASNRGIRAGNYSSPANSVRAAARSSIFPQAASEHIGFRICKSAGL
jgi:formylglycine-generating enzyme required for sulfatase activity